MNQALLNEFDAYLKTEKRSSDNTRQSYLRDLRQFSSYFGDSLLSANADTVNGYITYLKNEGRSPATIARAVASLKVFYKFCFIMKRLEYDPASELISEKVVPKSPEVLEAREVEILLDQPQCVDLKGYRDKAMLELLCATGIRVSELVALKVSDVDLKRGTITCIGEKSRTIPLSPSAQKAVSEYISFIRKQMIRNLNEQVLFVNVNGDPMTRQGFWKILKAYQKKAGISKNITPYSLRHSFAVRRLENGNPVKSVCQLMGQSELSAVGAYIDLTNLSERKYRN